jgi:hypothetical protein
MQGNLLSFLFINFSESGLFSSLRAKKIKTRLRRPARATGCGPTFQTAATSRPMPSENLDSVKENSVGHISDFVKQMSGAYSDTC